MAMHPTLALLLLLAASATIMSQVSAGQVLKGKVSCLDCPSSYDFSGIKVVVKCDKVKKLAVATTETKGSFEVYLPKDAANKSPVTTNPNCFARLVGGPTKLYTTTHDMASKIIITSAKSSSYTTSTPLAFSAACPKSAEKYCGLTDSKTVDLPLPREWGLAPSSYYLPFFPIIGIP